MTSAHRLLFHVVAMVMVVMALGKLPVFSAMPLVAAQSTDVASVAQQTEIPAALLEGSCADPGAGVARFKNAVLPAGSPVGNPDALPAANSYTTVPLPLDTILASEHAIVVADPAGNGFIACGEISGFQRKNGSLAIGLAGEQSSGVHGIAFLSPGRDGGSTGVSLFIAVPGYLAQASVSSEPTAGPEAEQVGGAVTHIDSGGLGLTVEEFHARYGTGKPDPLGEVIETENGRIVFTATQEGKVDFIERSFDESVSFEEARFIGMRLAPTDAELVATYITEAGYVTEAGSTTDLFYSRSLKAAFPPTTRISGTQFSTWTNGAPGQFTINYGGYNPANEINEVARIVIALGNNP
jgi:hypothetical protein